MLYKWIQVEHAFDGFFFVLVRYLIVQIAWQILG